MSKERIIHIIKTLLNNLIKMPAIIVMLIILITLIDSIGFPVNKSIFYGYDYLPPLWLTVVALPVFALRIILGYRKSASVFLSVFILYFISFGDANLSGVINSRSYDVQSDVSVAAVNVQYYAQGFEKVVGGIKQINADVVLLTENVLDEEQAAIYDSIAVPYNVVLGRSGSSAILSKYPVINYKEVELPSYQASLSSGNDIDTLHLNPHRAFLHALVDVNKTPVNIISVRLLGGRPKNNSLKESLRWGRYLIETHQKEIDFLFDYIESIDGHIIFGGDLNAHSTSKTVRKIKDIAVDAYSVSESFIGNTFRPPLPTFRIDYLFSKNGVSSINYKKLNLILSDHYPIYAEFIINKKRLLDDNTE